MTVQALPASSDQLVLTFDYDPTGLASVECSDHRVVAWLGDDGVGPGATAPATPVIPTGLPATPPNTGAILSPRWAYLFGDGDGIIAPEQYRGGIQSFFTWLATNNGAKRQVTVNFMHHALVEAWRVWSTINPQA